MHVLCMTRYNQVDRIRIFVIFVHRIYRQKEYCLSVAQNLTSRYQSRIDDGMQIDCTSDVLNVLDEIVSELITLSCKAGSTRPRPE